MPKASHGPNGWSAPAVHRRAWVDRVWVRAMTRAQETPASLSPGAPHGEQVDVAVAQADGAAAPEAPDLHPLEAA